MISKRDLDIKPFDKELAEQLAGECGISPLLAQLLINRGIYTAEEVDFWLRADDGSYNPLSSLHDPFLLPDMDKAADLLSQAVAEKGRVFICGDYDVDGVMASTILLLGLNELGCQVGCHLPHRFNEGFGFSDIGLEQALKFEASLLVTVDCGSSNIKQVADARAAGLKVIISDHHQVAEERPHPDAFVNANLPDSHYPFPQLCGTAVAWKLLAALRQRLNLPVPAEYLDLAAFATVADMVALRGENRSIFRAGFPNLARLERPGFKALAEVSRVFKNRINAQSIGYAMAPRINAAGRMDSATTALQLMLADNAEECEEKAKALDSLNDQRHNLENQVQLEIEKGLAEGTVLRGENVIFALGNWHKGILGICAQRLMVRYRMPSFVATFDGDKAVGSARTPKGTNLLNILDDCAQWLTQYGGHPNAGGFALMVENRESFSQVLGEACLRHKGATIKVDVDFELPIDQVTLELAHELARMEPTGKENEKPVFYASEVRVAELPRVFGRKQNCCSLKVYNNVSARQQRTPIRTVLFNKIPELRRLDLTNCALGLVYNLEESEWMGKKEVQIVVSDIVAPDPSVMNLMTPSREQLQVLNVPQLDPGSEEAVIPDEQPGRVADARNVQQRHVYAARLAAAGRKILAIVESPMQQNHYLSRADLTKAQFVLAKDLGESCPESLQGEEFDDVLLLCPPVNKQFLAIAELRQAERLHVLFDVSMLQRRRQSFEPYQLNREMMVRLYRFLQSRPAGFNGRSDSECAQTAGRLGMNLKALQSGLQVFEELNLLTWVLPEQVQRVKKSELAILKPVPSGTALSLDNSRTFRRCSSILNDLQDVEDLFTPLVLDIDF